MEGSSWTGCGDRRSGESENGARGGVDTPLVSRCETADEVARARDIDCAALLDVESNRDRLITELASQQPEAQPHGGLIEDCVGARYELLHRDALGQVAWLIDVVAPDLGDVISQ